MNETEIVKQYTDAEALNIIAEYRSTNPDAGRRKIAADTGIPEGKVKRLLVKLESMNSGDVAILEGFEIGENYLRILPGATEELIANGAIAMNKTERRRKWILGDMVLELERVWFEMNNRDRNVHRYRHEKDPFVQTLLVHSDLNWEKLEAYRDVCGKFPAPLRIYGNLSFTHYREIAYSWDSEAELKRWCEEANAHGWTCSELRERIRKAKSGLGSNTGHKDLVSQPFRKVTKMVREVRTMDLSQLEPQDRQVFMEELDDLVEWYQDAKRKW